MKNNNAPHTIGLISALSLSLISASQAAVTITFREVGSSLEVEFSGSYDTWTPTGTYTGISRAQVQNLPSTFGDDLYIEGYSANADTISETITTEPTVNPFGFGFGFSANSSSGDSVGFRMEDGDSITYYAPENYTAGTPISTILVFSGADYSFFGLTPGTSGTLDFGSVGGSHNYNWTVVPEPSTLVMLGFAGLATAFRRRR